jgi:hypothetical protein
MVKKTKKVPETVAEELKVPAVVDYQYYDEAALVIHCNKCNKLTHICTKDEEGNIVPIVIKDALDLTKLFGGPMPTDNHSAFPLFCDTCKTMLTLRFAPINREQVGTTVDTKVASEVVGEVEPVTEVLEVPKPKLEIVR